MNERHEVFDLRAFTICVWAVVVQLAIAAVLGSVPCLT